jgi:MFS family permease
MLRMVPLPILRTVRICKPWALATETSIIQVSGYLLLQLYFLSYLYRTVIASELKLPDSALGLLTSVYFLAFGAAQLPLGMALDRFGPRRVEAALLLVAASGAAALKIKTPADRLPDASVVLLAL